MDGPGLELLQCAAVPSLGLRPPPLRTDGSNEFARYSMERRVPAIARDVIAHGTHLAGAAKRSVERLARHRRQRVHPPPLPPAPDVEAWGASFATHARDTWLDAEWFYAEYAFYRELARACRFWETGIDPFAWAKEEELSSDALWARLSSALAGVETAAREERIASLMEASLWGNRVDLSYRIATARTHGHEGDLLADDRAAAVPLLVRPGAQVHVAADNTGTELALDLALVGALLEDEGASVTLHLKAQPVFVSDATPADVWMLLDRMRARGGGDAAQLADRLRAAFDAERLSFAPDPFWSGPRFLADMPGYLREALEPATMLLLKGDANYRRLSGDALGPLERRSRTRAPGCPARWPACAR